MDNSITINLQQQSQQNMYKMKLIDVIYDSMKQHSQCDAVVFEDKVVVVVDVVDDVVVRFSKKKIIEE